MYELRRPESNRQYIATIVIGAEFYKQWEKSSLPTWIDYCDRYDLGLLIFTEDLIKKDSLHYKKSNW